MYPQCITKPRPQNTFSKSEKDDVLLPTNFFVNQDPLATKTLNTY